MTKTTRIVCLCILGADAIKYAKDKGIEVIIHKM